jgi:hypothetical protein
LFSSHSNLLANHIVHYHRPGRNHLHHAFAHNPTHNVYIKEYGTSTLAPCHLPRASYGLISIILATLGTDRISVEPPNASSAPLAAHVGSFKV